MRNPDVKSKSFRQTSYFSWKTLLLSSSNYDSVLFVFKIKCADKMRQGTSDINKTTHYIHINVLVIFYFNRLSKKKSCANYDNDTCNEPSTKNRHYQKFRCLFYSILSRNVKHEFILSFDSHFSANTLLGIPSSR